MKLLSLAITAGLTSFVFIPALGAVIWRFAQ
jgi:hypothetical protein